MFSPDDSIVAIATPAGRGGIGIVRISGSAALEIAASMLERGERLEPRHATFTRVRVGVGNLTAHALDEVVVTHFPAPHWYTGQDVVEISAHGNPVVLQTIVGAAIAVGARLAAPGEFTLRAFLNGKRDLIQAEAVGDLIAAVTPLQARTAFDQLDGTLTRRIAAIDTELFDLIARLEASLDFPDEGYHFIEPEQIACRIEGVITHLDELLTNATRGRMIREGATVVIAGRTNVGKSSLFNVLAGADRAIVTAIPGTTRDLVSETVEIDGLAISLVDTAGWRETHDVVEREGVSRGIEARRVADLIVVLLDRSEPLSRDDLRLLEDTAPYQRLVVTNKNDLDAAFASVPGVTDVIHLSAATAEGIGDLRTAMVRMLTGGESLRDTAAISNARHISLVEHARENLSAAQQAANGETPEEFVLSDLQAARGRLEEIVGRRTTDDMLRHIFERFCIGK